MIAHWITMGLVTLGLRVMVDVQLGPSNEDLTVMRDPNLSPEEIPILWVSLLACVLFWPMILVETAIKIWRRTRDP